jgi:hypothetical protein
MRAGRYGGDETSLREFPPLRAAWSRIAEQAQVIIISGRNARRTVVGFLNVLIGNLVRTIRQRGRSADVGRCQGEAAFDLEQRAASPSEGRTLRSRSFGH